MNGTEYTPEDRKKLIDFSRRVKIDGNGSAVDDKRLIDEVLKSFDSQTPNQLSTQCNAIANRSLAFLAASEADQENENNPLKRGVFEFDNFKSKNSNDKNIYLISKMAGLAKLLSRRKPKKEEKIAESGDLLAGLTPKNRETVLAMINALQG